MTTAPTPQTTNYQRVTEGLQIVTTVLAPYVAQELRAKFADEWWSRGVLGVLHEHQRRDLPAAGADDALLARLDTALCLRLMDMQWHELFRQKLSREHRTWVKELITTRNKWAHAGLLDMSDDDAWRALDTMNRFVEQIDAEATERLRRVRCAHGALRHRGTVDVGGGRGRAEEPRGAPQAAEPACSPPFPGRTETRGGRWRNRILTSRRGATGRPSSRPISPRSPAGGPRPSTRTRSSSSPAPISPAACAG